MPSKAKIICGFWNVVSFCWASPVAFSLTLKIFNVASCGAHMPQRRQGRRCDVNTPYRKSSVVVNSYAQVAWRATTLQMRKRGFAFCLNYTFATGCNSAKVMSTRTNRPASFRLRKLSLVIGFTFTILHSLLSSVLDACWKRQMFFPVMVRARVNFCLQFD